MAATVTATTQQTARRVLSSQSSASSGPVLLHCGPPIPTLTRTRYGSQRPRLWNSTGKRKFHASPSCLESRPRISYRVAVSSSGKDRRFSPNRNVYNFDPQTHDAIGMLKGDNYHERKASRVESGEDAFFVSRINDHSNAVAFGVADGVGGWTESGVDPADFSHGFCTHMAQTALDWELSPDKLRPTALMQAGYNKSLNDKMIMAGGSTASIGVGYENGTIQLANLGDSGSILFRLAAVHHYSVPQTHGFNAPYQLSVLPPLLRIQAEMFGGRQYEDLPGDANVTNCKVQHGDVLVLATDGVFDNLNNQDILKVVSRQMMTAGAWSGTADMGIRVSERLNSLTHPGGLAALSAGGRKLHNSAAADVSQPSSQTGDKALDRHNRGQTLQALLALSVAGEAKLAGMNPRRDGPFAKESRRYYPYDPWRGGKPDDICVLVVVAVEEGRDDS